MVMSLIAPVTHQDQVKTNQLHQLFSPWQPSRPRSISVLSCIQVFGQICGYLFGPQPFLAYNPGDFFQQTVNNGK
jgi:hypothetical protein